MAARHNQSVITELWLLGFQNLHNSRLILFFVFLGISMASTAGNLLIISLVSSTQHLRSSPMYFFLSHLAVTDITITVTVSWTLLPALWNKTTLVSIAGCLCQFFVFASSTSIECFLLTVMSYDRYVAICRPLHYAIIMNFTLCHQLAICSWVLGFTVTLIIVIMVNNLILCGPNIIDHIFCDLNPLLQLSCSDTTIVQMTLISLGVPETVMEPAFIITTYVCIFLTILRIPSLNGREKAFSTCSSHLTVVCTYYGTLIAIYITPSGGHTLNISKFLSLLCTVLSPLFNPIIYCLKNNEIQTALQKCFQKLKCKYSE
ncbi:olfactory receptor 11A1-like [Xenopus tropicalis]|uniref:Olfactory receptor n=1 Tax=Xenopus tropicalis TaxID=8364 RepID=A0A8J1J8P0_XENTR|nr:olfactory receptor 11A1-like [Xenopus tropicalis]